MDELKMHELKIHEQAIMLVNRIKKNARRLGPWLKEHHVTCYRLYNRDIPEIPLQVDWYEGRLHLALSARQEMDDGDSMDRWFAAVVPPLCGALSVSPEDVFIKQRIKGPGGTLYGKMKDERCVYEVSEGGHRFFVNLSDYLDTGLFLDHRLTREMVKQEANGKRFLNLFAYTGSFSVYAASGGAASTSTVDMSNTWLDYAQANMALNDFSGDEHRYVREDILQALEDRKVTGEFDLVVIDPPSVSRSKTMRQSLDIQRDHVWMVNRVLDLVPRGGVVYFSNNLKSFKLEKKSLRAAAIDDITSQTIPPDFSNKKPHVCFRIEK